MHVRRLPPEEAAVRRYIEELWIPYNRDLAATVDAHALADDVDLLAEELEFRLDRLESDGYRAWVAVDGDPAEGTPLAEVDADLSGFVTTEVEESPSVFAWPDRLVVCDLYVREPSRGTGLAEDLMARAAERAREAGCAAVVLDVDVDNERAIAFYEKLGFETVRRRMRAGVGKL